MNDLMSGGVHRLWKDAVAARLNPQPGETDRRLRRRHRRHGPALREAGAARAGAPRRRRRQDLRGRLQRRDDRAPGASKGCEPEIAWAVGDAQRLPLPDASADAYVIAFGIRNVTDIAGALREARRVLKPGGRFLCLEFSRPTTEALRGPTTPIPSR